MRGILTVLAACFCSAVVAHYVSGYEIYKANHVAYQPQINPRFELATDQYSSGNGSGFTPDFATICAVGSPAVNFGLCNPITSTVHISATTPLDFTGAGGPNIITNAGGLEINDSGSPTQLFKVAGASTAEFQVSPVGTLTLGNGSTAASIVYAPTVGAAITTGATGAIASFVYNNTGAATGNPWMLFESNGTQEVDFSPTGDIQGAGALGQITNCAQTTTNASPSLLTLTGWNCKLTSGSATAVVFTITYPGSVTLGHAPLCLIQDLNAQVVEPTCTTTTTTATVTYNAAPTAVAFANIFLVKNGN